METLEKIDCKKVFKLKFPDSSVIEVGPGKNYRQIIEENIPGKLETALAVRVDGSLFDLSREVDRSGSFEVVDFNDEDGKEIFWHSSAHVLAQAIKRKYPEVQLTIGPVIKHGPGFFYYDVSLDSHSISGEDFEEIEKEMRLIVEENFQVTRHVYKRQEAVDEFNEMGEHFKAKIISAIPKDENITVYKQGEFQDLCRGPHIPSTNKLGCFKITAVSGSYWRGDPAQPMLQRIYGVSFPTQKELKKYLHNIEEAKKRDHRKLGKELELFHFEEYAPGMPFYLPKGNLLFQLLCEYIRNECFARGYQEIKTPSILSSDLWLRSGHYDNFKENMYFTEIEEKEFAIKPMNCPGANLIYKSKPRSYRDLPLRMAELGSVHRYELSGVLHGLFRVRSFTQDDAHIYCSLDQLQKEISLAIQFSVDVYKKFGFHEIEVFLATRPQKALGSGQIWEDSTHHLTEALHKEKIDYKIKEGEGAFYGPKIEFNIRDCLGRNWQCGTIQLDFSLPERFGLEYTGSDGKKHQPVLIHRAILGSLERFIGILIENFAGKLPFWISPVQVSILTVNDAQNHYAEKIQKELLQKGLRVETDLRREKIGYKIREWNQKKINYAIVLGKKEEKEKQISVRKRGEQKTMSLNVTDFIDNLKVSEKL